jgi:SAM-dependent methyltransferase
MSGREHWDNVYATKGDAEVSWTEADPRRSLSLIREVCAPPARVIDVGGGTSTLCDRLLDAGYAVSVLDISATALDRARARLGPRAADVRWIVADVADDSTDVGTHDCWHDRAVFHFLTDHADRQRYAALLARSVRPGGHAVIATFAPDGPEKCSGLPVCRYDGPALAAALGPALKLVRETRETHLTPWGKPQSFQYSLLQRT